MCTPYYSLEENALFTWDQTRFLNNTNQLSMTKDAVLFHGKFCKSGLASRFANDLAACYTIDKISLSNDKAASP
jgi:hypothetical protein